MPLAWAMAVPCGRVTDDAFERISAMALRKLPFLIPLTAQCSLVEPTRGIYEGFAAIEAATGATLSFTPGFPPADIRDCGPAVFAFAPDQARADAAADALTRQVLAARASKPVVLADTQDNPGAGGRRTRSV